jgi:23S rRNA (uracil1939-C5)-methyltransferase
MNRVVELLLDGIAHGGEAMGRHAGKVVFVPYAIPGERVRVEIVEEKERWARARLLEVLEISRDRVEPPCPFFGPGKCGGCQWQHIAYTRQAELKEQIVADQLQRLGRMEQPPVLDIIALADSDALGAPVFLDYGYRNQIDFAIIREGQTALRRAGTFNEWMPVEFCLLIDERLDQLHQALDTSWEPLTRLRLRCGVNTGDALVLLSSEGEEQPELEIDLPASLAFSGVQGVQPLIGDPFIKEDLNGRTYRVSALTHFPVNSIGAAALLDTVLAYANPQSGQVIIDAYCGMGLFSIPLADAGAEVIGMESSPAACEDFAINAGERTNLQLHEGNVEQILPALLAEGQRADIVVLDPPYTGAGPEVLAFLAQLEPRRIIYIASDPAALARDAAHLTGRGFRLVEAQPIDLTPQTFHVETVALWVRP